MLLVNDRVVDLLEGEFDVGVRIGRLRDSSLIAGVRAITMKRSQNVPEECPAKLVAALARLRQTLSSADQRIIVQATRTPHKVSGPNGGASIHEVREKEGQKESADAKNTAPRETPLALDWCSGTPLAALARRSFQLHAALPDQIARDWGYRRMTAYSGVVVPKREARSFIGGLMACSLRPGSARTRRPPSFIPESFTSAMMSAAQTLGAELRLGQITGMVWSADGSTLRGVEVDAAALL